MIILSEIIRPYKKPTDSEKTKLTEKVELLRKNVNTSENVPRRSKS
jgi:hypothetical protein